MTSQDITDQLQRIASANDFAARSAELSDAWVAAGAGLEVVEPILRFMEDHPDIDYGAPGPLVHFVERFYGKGYEERLIASVQRQPRAATVSMLNAVINGTSAPDVKQQYVNLMENVRRNPLADELTLQRLSRYLERHTH